jgi:hypothetical protein
MPGATRQQPLGTGNLTGGAVVKVFQRNAGPVDITIELKTSRKSIDAGWLVGRRSIRAWRHALGVGSILSLCKSSLSGVLALVHLFCGIWIAEVPVSATAAGARWVLCRTWLPAARDRRAGVAWGCDRWPRRRGYGYQGRRRLGGTGADGLPRGGSGST